jgi:hypothetical protein
MFLCVKIFFGITLNILRLFIYIKINIVMVNFNIYYLKASNAGDGFPSGSQAFS